MRLYLTCPFGLLRLDLRLGLWDLRLDLRLGLWDLGLDLRLRHRDLGLDLRLDVRDLQTALHSYRSHMRPKHGGRCWMVRSANDCKVSLTKQLRGVSCQAPNQPSQKYVTMLTSVFSLQYWKIPITYFITYSHQSNWPRIDCGNKTIKGNCPQLRKTRSPEKPSSPDCSCWIVININSDINSLKLIIE